MFIYTTLNYLALSVMFGLVLIDSGSPYIIGASLVLMALPFLGPGRISGSDLKAEVPKSQYWWLILFVGLLFFAPFYRVATGIDVLKIPGSSLKIVCAVAWLGLTVLYAQGIYFSLQRDKA